VSDKTEYKTARDMLVDCANNTYCLTEKLAEEYCDVILAEGERRQQEKDKSWFAGFGNVGIAEYEKRVKAQAKKEERERIGGIIAEMGNRFSRSNDYLEVVNIQQRVLLAIKSEIAKE